MSPSPPPASPPPHLPSSQLLFIIVFLFFYALRLRSVCSFVCLDDKHKIKIGEPGYPVASAQRGKKVSVRNDEVLVVGDHNFTKFSLVPSVIFLTDITEEICDSWYRGKYLLHIAKYLLFVFINV
jgi:hypothetical protein